MDVFEVFLPVAGVQFNWLILLFIGFSVGLMGGFFGIGGGPILTPALNIFGFPMAVAIGTGMLNVFGQSIVGLRKHVNLNNVCVRLGLMVGGAMLAGVELGKQIVMRLEKFNLEGSTVRVVYLVLLIGLTIRFLHDYLAARRRGDHRAKHDESTESAATEERPKPKAVLALSIGLGVGMLAGFLGVGGGFLLVPAFIYLLGLPTSMAVGTSVLCCVLSGAYGGISYAAQGRMDLIAVLLMLTGASFGAQFGASAVKYAASYGLRLLYGVMLLMAAVGVLLKQLDEMIATVDLSFAAQLVVLVTAGSIGLTILSKLVLGMRADMRA
ncbi:MAG: sulfite exporter TauE/SafE family protein [Candidatus Pacebacteria bacterium]|nr:sulfite exporter TauE/SafE family protein [Candidatus Paceibacterota bacterium]